MNIERLPKISIITPSFNSVEFIEKTIISVLDQRYPNLEHIIIDGGSTDGTIEILKRYNDKIIWISEKDKGQSDALNKGMRMSTGKILGELDSDDVYLHGTLQKVVNCFVSRPEIMWLTGKCKIINAQDMEVNKFISAYKNFWLKRYSHNKLFILNFISSPATFWRCEAIDKVGFFSTNEHYAMDYEYMLKLASKWHPFILDDYLAAFRVHPSSKGSRMFNRQFKDELRIAKRYIGNKKGLIFLHNLNSSSIILAYSILHALKLRN